ncbi:MAG: porin [Bacteroidetes bacterium]|nr:MAG: porin [Bacteroidota bacterium]
MDMIDTTKDVGKGLLSIYKRFDHIQISGYIQPQYQVADSAGIKSFSGGDFAPYSNNRFMIRRGRILFSYAHFDKESRPTVQFVLQIDGTERGVFIRDLWGRVYENKFQKFALAMGIFARPFGYEINLPSADRETPERGRMSQTLMKTERDLGAMGSFEDRKKGSSIKNLHFDIGMFNGPGLSGTTDYDSYKDLITQLFWKSSQIAHNIYLSGGISYYNGGIRQNSKYSYAMGTNGGVKTFVVDSSDKNVGRKSPRVYSGANVQIKFLHRWGATEIRGEYWQGQQTATEFTSETPGTIPVVGLSFAPYYLRKFNGAFVYFLQNIVNKKHQLVFKFDFYDPNTQVKGKEIGAPGSNTNFADIRYNTFGFGYIYYMHTNLKLMLWYDIVKNEATNTVLYQKDVKDNVLTCRLQFRF